MKRIALPLLTSCSLLAQAPAPEAHAVPFRPGHAAQPAPGPEPQDTDLLAHVGHRSITYGAFKKWLRLMAGPRAEMILKSPASRAQAQKQYLELQVFAALGEKEGIQKTQAFRDLMGPLRDQAYARVLMDDRRQGGAFAERMRKAGNPSEDEVRVYFEANKVHWATPETFSARQILVSTAAMGGGKARTDEEARQRVAQVQDFLKGCGTARQNLYFCC